MDPVNYTCAVCGYPALEEEPRPPSGGGSYEICPSCGFQFGVTDDDEQISYEAWRARWIRDGCPWSGIGIRPPDGWSPHEQMYGAGNERQE
jgi:ribosomal protein L37E